MFYCVKYRESSTVRDLDELFEQLKNSNFRQRMRLNPKEIDYLKSKGLPTVLEHAVRFINERLAPAEPPRDGKQTPFRGHPVFVAQHATATCCRGCLYKWHHIPKQIELSAEQKQYVLRVLQRWLEQH
jgi:Domain of unknown function (DUF4186)